MESISPIFSKPPLEDIKKDLLEFCAVPRSKAQIFEFLRIDSSAYNYKKYVHALVSQRFLKFTNEKNIKASRQQYITSIKGNSYLKSIS